MPLTPLGVTLQQTSYRGWKGWEVHKHHGTDGVPFQELDSGAYDFRTERPSC